MRVCICGTRYGTDPALIEKLFDERKFHPTEDVIVHGGARGVDSQAGAEARRRGFRVEVFAADWEQYGRAAGPIRNRQMIQSADVVYAFWKGDKGGTANAIETAKKLGRPVHVIQI